MTLTDDLDALEDLVEREMYVDYVMHSRIGLDAEPKGPHTVAEIHMRPDDHSATCACGDRFRANSDDALALAFAHHVSGTILNEKKGRTL